MATILGPNQYGKAEVRLVKITRDDPVHEIEDLNVTSQLRGDLSASHLTGDNSHVVATDTQKNTVYAYAREYGVGSPEAFLLRLGRHFVADFDWITGGRWAADQYSWERIVAAGGPHDHAFVKSGRGTRTTVVTIDGDEAWVLAGVTDLTILKSTGSEFTGFPRDVYTTLGETTDRVLATAVTSRWRYTSTELDFNAVYASILDTMLEVFADTHSLALQQTLYSMGEAVLDRHPDVAEVRFSMPNKHHFLVDLSPFGLDNPNEVFYAADRPYGLIEAAILRDDGPDAGRAWEGIPGFC